MDNISDEDITFDENGICNYYYEFEKVKKKYAFSDIERRKKLAEISEIIKSSGKDQQYDCILGLSGGVDSTYIALFAKQLGDSSV